jgi:His/Glu/Gln/Arg/opine family amino acid ABC transporter permease subunit
VAPADSDARDTAGRVVNRGSAATEERPEAIKAVPIRHWGRWVASAVILYIFVALTYSLAKNNNLDWGTVGPWMFKPLVLRGVVVTIELTVIAMVIGMVGGTVLAVMRLSKNYVLSTLAWLYIWFFRGTPVYVQILLWGNFAILYPRFFVGIPFTGLVFGSADTNAVIGVLVAAILALGLNEAAYAAELVRAGIISVDRGQTEAAESLGMSFGLTMRRVILPQAMRVIIPPMGNETISMLKTTSLVAIISGRELMTNITIAYSQNFKIMPLLIVACVWYLFLTTLLTIGQHYLERYFGKGFGAKETESAEKRAQKRLQQKVTADVNEPGNWD